MATDRKAPVSRKKSPPSFMFGTSAKFVDLESSYVRGAFLRSKARRTIAPTNMIWTARPDW